MVHTLTRSGDEESTTLNCMRLLTFLEYAAIAVGAIAIFAGGHYALVKGVHLGIFLIGAGLAVGGIESLYSRRMSLRFSEDAAEGYSGFPALVWGMMLLLAGAALIGYAYLLDVGFWPRAQRLLKQNPGFVYIAAGMLLAGFSVLLFTDTNANRNRWQTLLLRVPRVIVALVALTCGVAGMASGAWQIADPQGFAQVERQVRARLDAAVTFQGGRSR
jgi:type II secretory pathway component PulF